MADSEAIKCLGGYGSFDVETVKNVKLAVTDLDTNLKLFIGDSEKRRVSLAMLCSQGTRAIIAGKSYDEAMTALKASRDERDRYNVEQVNTEMSLGTKVFATQGSKLSDAIQQWQGMMKYVRGMLPNPDEHAVKMIRTLNDTAREELARVNDAHLNTLQRVADELQRLDDKFSNLRVSPGARHEPQKHHRYDHDRRQDRRQDLHRHEGNSQSQSSSHHHSSSSSSSSSDKPSSDSTRKDRQGKCHHHPGASHTLDQCRKEQREKTRVSAIKSAASPPVAPTPTIQAPAVTTHVPAQPSTTPTRHVATVDAVV